MYHVVVVRYNETVNVGSLLGVWVSDESFHFPNGGPELPLVNVEVVGGKQGVRSGGLPRGANQGSCCNTGPLELDPDRKLVSV